MAEVGCAFVVPAPGARPTAEETIAYCREQAAATQVPAHVAPCAASDLPLTVFGKVQKFVLAERASAVLGLDTAAVAALAAGLRPPARARRPPAGIGGARSRARCTLSRTPSR